MTRKDKHVAASVILPNPRYIVQLKREVDGRWIAFVPGLHGVWAYGADQEEAKRNAIGFGLRVIGDLVASGQTPVAHDFQVAFSANG